MNSFSVTVHVIICCHSDIDSAEWFLKNMWVNSKGKCISPDWSKKCAFFFQLEKGEIIDEKKRLAPCWKSQMILHYFDLIVVPASIFIETLLKERSHLRVEYLMYLIIQCWLVEGRNWKRANWGQGKTRFLGKMKRKSDVSECLNHFSHG